MVITGKDIDVRASSVQVDGGLEIVEMRISSGRLAAHSAADGVALTGAVQVSLAVAETSVNGAIAAGRIDRIDALEVAFLRGRLRVQGRVKLLLIPVPFEIIGRVTPDGGAGLRFDVDTASVGGAPLPGWVTSGVSNLISARVSGMLTPLPVPLRVARVDVEPGRLTVIGDCEMDGMVLRPPRAIPGA